MWVLEGKELGLVQVRGLDGSHGICLAAQKAINGF